MFSKIKSLMEKYKDNEYMTQKLNHHINVNLENLLEKIYLNHIKIEQYYLYTK